MLYEMYLLGLDAGVDSFVAGLALAALAAVVLNACDCRMLVHGLTNLERVGVFQTRPREMSARENRRDVERVVEHLRDTITPEMAAEAYRCRYDEELDDSRYDDFVEELISEHYNAGLDEWDEEFLYYD